MGGNNIAMRSRTAALVGILFVAAAGALMLRGAPDGADAGVVWRFDNLERIGGHPVTVLGHPSLIDTPAGKAVQFNGVDDGLFIDDHPLAGAGTFTWEVVFRPDAGGRPEQRFFHLQERDRATGVDTEARMLFEIRVIGDRWCLDSFVRSDATRARTLLDRSRLHPLGEWHHAAAVYDGREFRNYVDGIEQGAGPVELTPQQQGHSSVGVRINKVDYFKGAILVARMTPKALAPGEFLEAKRVRALTRHE
jgi:hypothetical protein